jgi:hypothetical protein
VLVAAVLRPSVAVGTGGWHRRRPRLSSQGLALNTGMILSLNKFMNFTVLHDTVGNGTVVRNRIGQLKQYSFYDLIKMQYSMFLPVCHFW